MYPSNLPVNAVVLITFVVELTINAWLLSRGIGVPSYPLTRSLPPSHLTTSAAVIHDSRIHG